MSRYLLASRLRRGRSAGREARGFTLLELMVTLAVAAILVSIAVPTFRRIIVNSELNSTADDIVGAIRAARLEAIKRNAQVQFCSNSSSVNTSDTLGTACASSAAGAVYVAVTSTSAVLVQAPVPSLKTPVQLSGDVQALRFDGMGLAHAVGSTAAYASTVANICTPQINSDNHRVITMSAGMITTITTSSGTCP